VSTRYVENVIHELRKGETRVGIDEDGNAIVGLEVKTAKGATRLVPIAKVTPIIQSGDKGEA